METPTTTSAAAPTKMHATMTMVRSTTTEAVWKTTIVACVTDLVTSMSVDAPTFPKTTAIAMATRKMPWAYVAAPALQTTIPTASVTTWTIAWANTIRAGFATDQEKFTSAVVPTLRTNSATAKATSKMLSGCVEELAKQTLTTTGFAMPSIHAWGNTTLVAFATVQARCMHAVVGKSLQAIAIATATNWMHWASAEELAKRTSTTMAFATTWTIASGLWMLVAYAMETAQVVIADATTFLKAIAIAMATSWMSSVNVVAHAPPTKMAMAFATTSTCASAAWMRAACATVLGRFWSAVVKASHRAIAIATATSWTPSAFVAVAVGQTWMPTAYAMWSIHA